MHHVDFTLNEKWTNYSIKCPKKQEKRRYHSGQITGLVREKAGTPDHADLSTNQVIGVIQDDLYPGSGTNLIPYSGGINGLYS